VHTFLLSNNKLIILQKIEFNFLKIYDLGICMYNMQPSYRIRDIFAKIFLPVTVHHDVDIMLDIDAI